jgi:subtilisin family serine protease
MRSTPDLGAAAASADASVLGTMSLGDQASFQLDTAFAPIEVPTALGPNAQAVAFDTAPGASTYVVRGDIADDNESAYLDLTARGDVAGVFADPTIETCIICPGAPAQGTAADVASLLGVSQLQSHGMDGQGVGVAIVDTGINQAHLTSKGQTQSIDANLSFTPAGVGTTPGQHPLGHGTMCAFDTGIAAPAATLLDHAVLLSQTGGPTVMSGLLSDAIRSYSVLLGHLLAPSTDPVRLVVNNSWGMFNPSWDFPIGHPGNYSDNINHPFNVIVGSLDAAGADIFFAAGNCGLDCPDGRCAFGGTRPICGANSHPSVTSVAGVDTTKLRVGYSSQGPGRLSLQKPDVCGYTHFLGSEAFGVNSADGGTSAATPVVAGLAAAIRTQHAPSTLTPASLRTLLQKTAEDLGTVGFDSDHGWGVVDTLALLAQLPPTGKAPVVAPPYPGRLLKYPPLTQGTDVVTWQSRMVERGIGLVIDGKYGPKSKEACIGLQKQASLEVDGIVGPKTWQATWLT